MYQVEDEPMETIHVYVVREGQPRPSLLPVILSLLALSLLVAFDVLTPYQQPETRTAIRVPAVLLPLRTLTTIVTVKPTGSKISPATQATGVLTIYNGSILAQALPQGLIVVGKDGSEVVTDHAVLIPPGNPPNFGVASVTAHASAGGAKGNIQAYDIDEVYGQALYIRNLHALKGGKDAATTLYITLQDTQNALAQARASLTQQTLSAWLYHPCAERITGRTNLYVSWMCQFVTYHVPAFAGIRVLHVQVVGTSVVLEVVYPTRPQRLETK